MTGDEKRFEWLQFVESWQLGQTVDSSQLRALRQLLLQLEIDDRGFERVCSVYVSNAGYDPETAKLIVSKLERVLNSPTFERLLAANQVMTSLNADWGAYEELLPLALSVLFHKDENIVQELLMPSVIAIGKTSFATKDEKLVKILLKSGRKWYTASDKELAKICALGLCLAKSETGVNCYGKKHDLKEIFGT